MEFDLNENRPGYQSVKAALDSLMPLSESKSGDFKILEREFCNDDSKCTVGLAQVIADVPDTNAIRDKMLAVVDVFKSKNVNMIVFPELFLSGYVWRDKNKDETACWKHMRESTVEEQADWVNENLVSQLDDKLKFIVFGCVRKGPKKKFYNSSFVLAKGHDWLNPENNYDKVFIPGIEKIYCETGLDDRLVVESRWGKFGFTICYDYCFSQLIQEYSVVDDIDAIVEIAAWSGGGSRQYPQVGAGVDGYYAWYWDTIMSSRSCTHNIWTIACNNAGVHPLSGVQFMGKSGIWAPSGIKIIEGSKNANQDELLIVYNIPLKEEVKKEEESSDKIVDFRKVYRPVKGKRCFTRIW
jgi:predicted amidohydrolase